MTAPPAARRIGKAGFAVFVAALAAGCEAGPGSDAGGRADRPGPSLPAGVDTSGARVDRFDAWPDPVDLDEGRRLHPAREGEPADEEVPLARVADLLPRPGGGVYVADAGFGELLAVDGDGRVQWRAGGEGEGPGEFAGLSGLHRWPGDTLVALDAGDPSASFWTASGEHVRTLPAGPLPPPGDPDLLFSVPAEPIGVLGDGRPVARGPHRIFGRGRAGLRRARTSVTVVDSAGPRAPLAVPGPWMYELRRPGELPVSAAPMGGTAAVEVADGSDEDDLVWARSDTFRVLLLDADGTVRRIFQVDEPRQRATRAEKRRYREGWTPWSGVEEEIPFPPRVPAFDRVFLATDGDVWARRRHDRWPGRGEEWVRFARSGREIDRFRFPRRVEVMAARRDVAYGVRRDALDVERIVVFELPR